MAKGIGPDLEAEQRRFGLAPSGEHHATPQGRQRHRRSDPGLAAERAEIALADQWVAGEAHGTEIERSSDLPGGAVQERARHRIRPEVVPVLAPPGREPGVEIVGRPRRRPDDDRRPRRLVDPPLEVPEIGRSRQVEAHHLTPGVHARVGPPGSGQGDRHAHDPDDGVVQRSGDRDHAHVGRESVKRRTLIGHEETSARHHRGRP